MNKKHPNESTYNCLYADNVDTLELMFSVEGAINALSGLLVG